ncbi:MAG: DUF2096 domain-containing protein [Methanosphaera sp.]|uniref:DUF2096 domain-containing protein n=1 Tax=Methanosphaera sp. ISO3-F5 TaxID=1452353 RepID=UPI002B25752E|nr:DUF2096 domain-containing protein [Methanosphaera sp. ISO3-F5]MBR0471585.1 DUF2096 domain-containing protein [Methanosphaera sp.]WQH64708.1 DUF2096 domain-containing protein [Methanosphaera sp. ISO3-F5]
MASQELQDPLEQRWVVLDHLLKILNKKYDVPSGVIKNLQYARSLTSFYLQDPTEPDRAKELPNIDSLLNNAETTLMGMAGMEGEDFVAEWEQKLLDASKGKEVFKQSKIQSKFIPGMPANFDFVRFNFKQPIHEERFIEICEYENVIIEFDDNDLSVFVFGENDNIQKALKEMAPFYAEQLSEI